MPNVPLLSILTKMAFSLKNTNIVTKTLNIVLNICIFQANIELGQSSVSMSDFIPCAEADGASRFRFGDDQTMAASFTSGPFKFLNHAYWTVYISGNGLISFVTALSAAGGECETPTDIPMVMAFWADANEGVDPQNSQLTYMETTNTAYKTKIVGDIRRAFPQHRRISLTWMFVVTWRNIAAHNSPYSSRRNTYQLILATNGVSSFVILYYNELNWGSGIAGFDFGSARKRQKLPGSCSASIQNLAQSSNMDVPGKWIFQVDSDVVEPSSSVANQCGKPSLRLDPPVVSIMGNFPLFVHGLCLEENANVTCTFLDKAQPRPSETKAILLPDVTICPVPFLYSLGKVILNILVGYPEQSLIIHTQNIFVVKEQEFSDLPLIHISHIGNSQLLSAQWNPELLAMTAIRNFDNESNLDTKMTDAEKQCEILSRTVQIVILEYDGKKWQNQGPIIPPVLNNGVHMSHLNTSLLNALLPRKGKVLLRTFALEAKYTLQSGESVRKMFPSNSVLGTDNLIDITIGLDSKLSRTNFFDKVCQTWYDNEPNLHLDTLPCPNIVEQARLDWRFSLDAGNVPYAQLLNKMASAVYLQRVPSQSDGATQCAYDNDGLLLSQLPDCGRVFRRSPNSIKSYWRHYLDDVLPHMYCCRWGRRTNENKCKQYFAKRPINFGADYVTPRPIRAVGDPHITTFDGLAYTFNGAGEYWMIKYNDDENDNHVMSEFKMQVRMEPFMPLDRGPSNASVITAAVMEEIKNEYEVKVQVDINQGFGMGLSVIVDGEPLEVFRERSATNDDDNLPQNDSPWNFQNGFTYYHDGVIVVLKSTNEAVVSFASGFAFNFKAVHDSSNGATALNIVGQAGANVKNKIEGLLGNYDGVIDNDFKLRNGSLLETNLTLEDIHNNFGMHWVVGESETIFSYSPGKSYANFHQPAFYPWLLSPDEVDDLNLTDEDFCDNFEDCVFDYLATGSKAIAIGTKGSSILFQEIDDISKKVVGQCSPPPLPSNGYFNATSFVVGSTLRLRCSSSHYSSNLTEREYKCAYQDGAEDPAIWIDSTGLTYDSMVCEKKNTVKETVIVPNRDNIKQEVNPAAKLTSESSSVGAWVFFIGMVIFAIITVVVIVEYPPCKPVKQFFTNKYYNYRVSRIRDDGVTLN